MWFKQILFEIDSVREVFMGVERKEREDELMKQDMPTVQEAPFASSPRSKPFMDLNSLKTTLPDAPVDESKMFEIINRMQRVAMILKVRYLNFSRLSRK